MEKNSLKNKPITNHATFCDSLTVCAAGNSALLPSDVKNVVLFCNCCPLMSLMDVWQETVCLLDVV